MSPPGPEREGPLSPPGHPKGEHRSAEREGNSLTAPDLTVVVTVVEGGTALTRCLEALSAQIDAPAMEIIVPFDSTMQQVNDLASRFPDYRFMDLGAVVAPGIRANEFTRHILYDCRRTAGLKAALGRYVAMLEDRGWPRKDWARTMVSLHEQMPHAVIGGAIESGAVGALRSAAFYCDFGRYEPPFAGGDAQYVSDVNICYKRAALDAVRPLWESRYQEATVNWALQRQGLRLHLSDQPRVIEERGPLRLWPALAERVHWGRTFGYVRGREGSRAASVLRVVAAPLVPALLLLRHARKQLALRRRVWSFARVLPATFLLMVCWSLGEAIGELEAILASGKTTALPDIAAHQARGVRHERSC